MPISTSSPSASTGANRAAGASCSTGFSNKLLPSSRFPTNPWSSVPQTRISETTRCWGYGSQINTHPALFTLQADLFVTKAGEERRDHGLRGRHPAAGQHYTVGVVLPNQYARGTILLARQRETNDRPVDSHPPLSDNLVVVKP